MEPEYKSKSRAEREKEEKMSTILVRVSLLHFKYKYIEVSKNENYDDVIDMIKSELKLDNKYKIVPDSDVEIWKGAKIRDITDEKVFRIKIKENYFYDDDLSSEMSYAETECNFTKEIESLNLPIFEDWNDSIFNKKENDAKEDKNSICR